MKTYLALLFTILAFYSGAFAQGADNPDDSTEVTIIDSYVTPDAPHNFLLSFYTSDSCKSKLVIENKGEFIVSKENAFNHKLELNINDLKINTSSFEFYLIFQKRNGKIQKSEKYEVEMPVEQIVENRGNFLTNCLLGGVVFLTPSPTYIRTKDKSQPDLFGLTKEIPIVSFHANGYNYPSAYISLEYSYIFKSDSKYSPKNTLRLGYKHVFEIPVFEYVSAGVSGFTNFNGMNGISPEVSLGLFNFYSIFTVTAKYRYNIKPNDKNCQFHEISIGLFASFFSVHL
jgi:hypothetical protein